MGNDSATVDSLMGDVTSERLRYLWPMPTNVKELFRKHPLNPPLANNLDNTAILLVTFHYFQHCAMKFCLKASLLCYALDGTAALD